MNASASAIVLCIFQLPAISGRPAHRGHASDLHARAARLPSSSSSDGAAAGREVGDAVGEAELGQRGGAVAAADDGRARRLGHRLGDRARAGGERLELERAHRAVPEDGARARDLAA